MKQVLRWYYRSFLLLRGAKERNRIEKPPQRPGCSMLLLLLLQRRWAWQLRLRHWRRLQLLVLLYTVASLEQHQQTRLGEEKRQKHRH